MKNNKIKTDEQTASKRTALHYMTTLVDVARESFLILDSHLRVILANPTFYQVFRVSPKETENEYLYALGTGQWNIPALKTLLEEILPKSKTIKNYEVKYAFPAIGEKTMLLNARQIDSIQLIILAMEDITVKKQLENKLTEYTKDLEVKVAERTVKLTDKLNELKSLNKTMVGRELKMMELKREIESLKKRIKNGGNKNGGNGNHKNGR